MTVLEQYPQIKPIQKQEGEPDRRLTFTVPAALRRAGLGIKLHIEGEAVIPDIKLIQLLVKADLYFRALMQDKHLSMTKLAVQMLSKCRPPAMKDRANRSKSRSHSAANASGRGSGYLGID